MLRKKGIVRKTFLFSSLLIVMVMLLSFSVMYFVMPGYYLLQKERMLQNNLNTLTAELQTAKTAGECVSLISGFVETNNVNVMAFDAQSMPLPTMSSPFVSMQGSERGNSFYTVIAGTDDAVEGQLTVSVRMNIREDIQGGETDQGDNVKHPVSIYEWDMAGETHAWGTNDAKVHMLARGIKTESSISLRGGVGTELVDYVIVSSTLQPIDEARGVILSLIPYVLLGAVAVGLLLAWLYARQISKPVLAISQAAVKMRDMEPDAVSSVYTDDELGQLSQNLNDLYANLRKNIESLKDEMERVNLLERSKTEMMQSASHELKTPVAALSGMLDGMIDNVGAYKNRDKYLLECKGQAEKLSWLVKEILDASRADSHEQDIQEEETAIECLFEQAIEEYAAMISEKELRIEKSVAAFTVSTDPAMLYRVLVNLVSNAVRYTPEKGVIRAVLVDGLLSIENMCEPVPEEELEKLFEPFYTRSLSRDKSHSGTGLGLYIAKRNLERLKISYKLENTETGMKITLTF